MRCEFYRYPNSPNVRSSIILNVMRDMMRDERHTYANTYIHTYANTYINTHTYANTYIHAYTNTCTYIPCTCPPLAHRIVPQHEPHQPTRI